jgi:hypothetical protein
LSERALGEVNDSYRSGRIVLRRTLYQKVKVDDFKYTPDGTGYQLSLPKVERLEWDLSDRLRFIEEVIKGLPEYSDCLERITSSFETPLEEAKSQLYRFAQALVTKSPENANAEFAARQVEIFMKDLERAPIDWKAVVFLRGIWPNEEECLLSDRILLRRPNAQDLEAETEIAHILTGMSRPLEDIGSAVLDFSLTANTGRDVQVELELIISALRLFRLGSISAIRAVLTPRSVLQPEMNFRPAPYTGPYQYEFRSEDSKVFAAFLDRMKPILASRAHPGSAEADVMDIALDRYREALLNVLSPEGRITSAITCMEALYLKARERAELSNRLAQRVSALLRFVGCRPLKVYHTTLQAYEIRSTFIHGSQVEQKHRGYLAALCERVMEYARLSLLVFLQLGQTLDKETLISRLDRSLLDEKMIRATEALVGERVMVTR